MAPCFAPRRAYTKHEHLANLPLVGLAFLVGCAPTGGRTIHYDTAQIHVPVKDTAATDSGDTADSGGSDTSSDSGGSDTST